jgi:NADP-reducing hydrogenase subunit HndB
MTRIKSLDELKNKRDELKSALSLLDDPDNPDRKVQIKVAMATCGIASGARSIKDFLTAELSKRNIPSVVTQTGCMGYCYAEPTIEVKLPGREAVIFGYVDRIKADKIIEKYIKKGELTEGVIPRNYSTID